MTLPFDASNLRSVHQQERFATGRVVAALMLREMTTTYGRSPGGYAWAIIEPLATIALLSWVFSLALHQPQLGTSFIMFYATGWLPFHVFMEMSQACAQSLNYSRQLLAYPRVTFLDAIVARLLLNLLVQLLVSFIVIAAVRLFNDTGTTLRLPQVVLGFTMAAALAAGIGTLNCFLFSMFPLWHNLWPILMRPIVIISGVIILVESVPDPWGEYLLWNPLAHVVAEVRSGFYYSYHPDYVRPGYVFGVALVAGVVGLVFLRRYSRDLRDR